MENNGNMEKDETAKDSKGREFDGRKVVIAFAVLMVVLGILFMIFKPEKPLGGPTNYLPPLDEKTPAE